VNRARIELGKWKPEIQKKIKEKMIRRRYAKNNE